MVDTDDSRVSDETLIGRIAAGDPSSFDRLVRRHQAAVYRFARAAVSGGAGEAEEAGEILHETFRAAWRAAHRHRDEPSARPWLLALARQAIGRRNARSPEPDLTPLRELARSAGWGSSGDDPFGEDGPGMEAAFAALPAADREILTLCDREYFTVDETARVTGLADAAVHTRLHRARLRLLARWAPPAAGALREEQVAAGLHCGEVLADLTEHLDGRLSRDRAQRIDEHLEECTGCRHFESAVTAVVRALRQLPDEALPSEVEESLLDALRTGEAASQD